MRSRFSGDLEDGLLYLLAGLAGEIYCLAGYRIPTEHEFSAFLRSAEANAQSDRLVASSVISQNEPERSDPEDIARRLIAACRDALFMLDRNRERLLRLTAEAFHAAEHYGFVPEHRILNAFYEAEIDDSSQTYHWAAANPTGEAAAILALDLKASPNHSI